MLSCGRGADYDGSRDLLCRASPALRDVCAKPSRRPRMRPRPNCFRLLTPTSLSLALCLFLTGCRGGGQADVPASMRRIAMELPQTDGPLVLHVRSDAFEVGSEIPDEYSADGRNISPSLAWSGVPQGAQSVVVIVE